jgi:hypothetical protein
MPLGISLFLIAIGAILTFAVTADVAGIALETVGVILLIVGGIGLLLSLLIGGFRGTDEPDRTTVVRDRAV